MMDDKPWYLKQMTLESLKGLITLVKEAHREGLGFASVTMNQIEIALTELLQRMENETTQAS